MPISIEIIVESIKLIFASEGNQKIKEGEKKSNPSKIAKNIKKPIVIIAASVRYFQLENTVFILFVNIDTFILISYSSPFILFYY